MSDSRPQAIKRRNFILAGLTSALALPAALKNRFEVNALSCLPKQLKVPAAQMRSRADVVRNDFVSKHLSGNPPQPYPFAKAFHTSSMLPSDPNIAKRLLLKGDGYLRLNAQGNLVNGRESDRPIDAPFDAVLCDKTFRFTATFPGRLEVKPTATPDSLTLEIVSREKILITLVDNLPGCGNLVSIGLKQNIDRIAVSTSEIRMETSHYRDPNCKFTLILDLTTSPGGAAASVGRRLRSYLYSALRISVVALVLYLQLGSACCGTGCRRPPNGNGTDRCPSRVVADCCGRQYSDSGFPYVNMGNYAYSNACHAGAYNNTCAYEDVTVKRVGCRLRVCNPQTVPTGWKVLGYETDISRCSGDTYSDNIMVIEKVR